ncbi:MAG: SMC-Scp complex subunit ScpB, partial [Mogibacterium diversum]|nr:SMC-Scp complex subunit ScpB [Mogibacterium diversum]
RVIDGLMSKDLVDVAGRSEGVGRPLLYKTTGEFLKKFGFASIKDLPDITEFDDIEEYDEETPHEQLSINFEGDADSEDK